MITTSPESKELTLERLESMERGIFAFGTYYVENIGIKKWVAARGGFHDWAIYVGNESQGISEIWDEGEKIYNEKIIRSLVPCTDEAFKMYRQ